MENIADKVVRPCFFLLKHGYAVVEEIVSPSVIADVHRFLSGATDGALDAAQKALQCGSASVLIDIAGRITSGQTNAPVVYFVKS